MRTPVRALRLVEAPRIETQSVDGATRHRFVKERVRVEAGATLELLRKREAPHGVEPAPTRGAVLLVHGFGQNRYAWHLPTRSLSAFLAAQGYDTFNLDLRGHGRSRAPTFSAEDSARDAVAAYVREDVPAALFAVRALSGHARPFVLGHSMGALVAGASIGIFDEAVAGLGALAVPYHFARGSRTLRAFSRALVALAPARAVDARVPVSLIGRAIEHTRPAWEAPFIPLPVRAWAPGTLAPHEARTYLRTAFDSAALGSLVQLARIGAGQGTFASLDGREDYGAAFASARVPLLVLAGTRDQLAPPASVRPAFDHASTSDRTYHEVNAGHGDLLIGTQAPRESWPLVLDWIRAREPAPPR